MQAAPSFAGETLNCQVKEILGAPFSPTSCPMSLAAASVEDAKSTAQASADGQPMVKLADKPLVLLDRSTVDLCSQIARMPFASLQPIPTPREALLAHVTCAPPAMTVLEALLSNPGVCPANEAVSQDDIDAILARVSLPHWYV